MPTTPSDNRDEILISLGEIKGQLAGFIASQAAQDRRMDTHEDRMNLISDRVHSLEKSKSWLLGAAAAAGSAISFVINKLISS